MGGGEKTENSRKRKQTSRASFGVSLTPAMQEKNRITTGLAQRKLHLAVDSGELSALVVAWLDVSKRSRDCVRLNTSAGSKV